jgi:hypothetical protein
MPTVAWVGAIPVAVAYRTGVLIVVQYGTEYGR